MTAVTLVQGIVPFGIVIASKWMLLGQRREGSYPYDDRSYCQHWQIQRTIDILIENSFGGTGIRSLLTGTAYLSWFYRAMGATIGADCALNANGDPHIFLTKLDLVTRWAIG
ncbi:hypothetical protein AnigIFM49718_005046 [Aspergillus niger]|nr:hypothetical protein AnigIFM49718_005046 [Aspergillus niger]